MELLYMDWLKNRRMVYLLVVAVWAIIYLPCLDKLEFRGEEGRRVFPGQNMLHEGNWMVPHISDEPYYNKPPGVNWLVALSFVITGQENEWAARLPSAVSILMFVSLLMLYPAKWFRLDERLIASLIYLTAGTMIEKGRMIELEGVVSSITGIVIFYWMAEDSNNRNKWLLWIPLGLIMGFGMLLKGPFVPFFFYTTIIPILFYQKRCLKQMFSPQHIVGFLIMAAIFFGWYLDAKKHTSGEAMTNQMVSQLLIRFNPKNTDWGYWSKEVIDAFVNFLPWVLFLPALWNKQAISQFEGERKIMFNGCRLGLIIGFVLINLLPMTESRYSIPFFCQASILLGMTCANLTASTKFDLKIRDSIYGFYSFAAFAPIVLLVVLRAVPASLISHLPISESAANEIISLLSLPVTVHGLFVATICIVIYFALLKYKERINNTPTICAALAGLMVMFAIIWQGFGIPAYIHINERYRPAAAAVNSIVPENENICLYRPGYKTFTFYMRKPLTFILEKEKIDNSVEYLVISRPMFDELLTDTAIKSRNPEIVYEFSDMIEGQVILIKFNNTENG